MRKNCFIRMLVISLILFIGHLTTAQAQSIIEVTPTDYDFGNVTKDDFATTIITIQNIDGHILTITGISLTGTSDPDFNITSAPPLPAVLDWNGG